MKIEQVRTITGELDLFVNGDIIGFITKDGDVGLSECPSCGYENFPQSIMTGQCAWCEWKPEEEEMI